MGNTDSIPVVSQLKAVILLVTGDLDGALRTHENFMRGCIILSQITLAVQLLKLDTKAAKETQMYFARNLSNIANGIPVVGHVKGVLHYACGDISGGNGAMIAATRTTVVMAGLIAGYEIGRRAGAIAGGMAAGVMIDGITTKMDTAVKGELSPHGHFACGLLAARGELNAGRAFDWTLMPFSDAFAIYMVFYLMQRTSLI